jgi:hypothetical protein
MRLLIFQEEINNLLLPAGQICHSIHLYTIPIGAGVKRELFTKCPVGLAIQGRLDDKIIPHGATAPHS